ncbi:hypothetical protein DXG01_003028, partial [Tephrocybe rancida]
LPVSYIELVVVDDGLNHIALLNTIGTLPLLPPSLDTFLSQLLPPLLPDIVNSGSTVVPSQAKRSHEDKKTNPFLDLEAKEDSRDNTEILGEGEADNGGHVFPFEIFQWSLTFTTDDFIDDRNNPTEQDAQSNIEVPGGDDEDLDVFLDDNKEQFSDNEYPLSTCAISHKTLGNHNNLEQQ